MDEPIENPSSAGEASAPARPAPYEPPRVERRLTQEDLQEMVHGIVQNSPLEW
jgi:hypothetical protein